MRYWKHIKTSEYDWDFFGDKHGRETSKVRTFFPIQSDKILLIKEKDKVSIGKPYIKNAKIELEVVSHKRDKKIIVYKMRPKKKTRRKMGHRQELTRVMVKSISIANSTLKTSSKTEVKKKSTSPKASNPKN